ncbi:hypothetical protein BS50DRAFT_480979, partial [Corynespora cassiicola Philippines]
DITIDFVTRLLTSYNLILKVFYNTILVVIDRFTKYAEIILFRNNYTALELVQIILNCVVRYYRLL